jgi:hypothetical protein
MTLGPRIDQVCGSRSDCSADITLINRPSLTASAGGESNARRATAVDGVPDAYLGAAITCPPFCPGLMASGSIFPYPVNSNGTKGSFVPAVSIISVGMWEVESSPIIAIAFEPPSPPSWISSHHLNRLIYSHRSTLLAEASPLFHRLSERVLLGCTLPSRVPNSPTQRRVAVQTSLTRARSIARLAVA